MVDDDGPSYEARDKVPGDQEEPRPGQFLIEIAPEGASGPQLQSGRRRTRIPATEENLEQAAAFAHRAGRALKSTFDELAPSKGTVEFALAFVGEAGVPMLARGKASATLTITLEWGEAGA
jgi:Trypsin-co-occurring domain 1